MLPHLERLDLHSQGAFSQSFFNSLAESFIQHLNLHRVFVDEDFMMNTLAKSWPLRTLHLEIRTQKPTDEVTTAPLCTSILRLCAPTLESLVWNCFYNRGEHSFTKAGSNSALCFPRLWKLSLYHVKVLDSSVLDAFIHDGIRTLVVFANFDPEYAVFFQNRGSIPSLKTFDLHAFGEYLGPTLRFLMANTNLSLLRLRSSIPAAFLETQLLPLLSSSFSKLESLTLFWKDTSISESALEMISSLNSLQQIHFSGGRQHGLRQQFQIDHEAMQRHLQKLVFLKNIAFSRDSYSNKLKGSSLQYFYQRKFLAEADPADPEERNRIWEQKHRERILAEANEYGRVMPQLEWLFFGQISMGFKELEGTQGRIAVALTTERCPYHPLF